MPAKSNALKNISGSSNDRTKGGNKVNKYGKGFLSPLGNLSTANFKKLTKVKKEKKTVVMKYNG